MPQALRVGPILGPAAELVDRPIQTGTALPVQADCPIQTEMVPPVRPNLTVAVDFPSVLVEPHPTMEVADSQASAEDPTTETAAADRPTPVLAGTRREHSTLRELLLVPRPTGCVPAKLLVGDTRLTDGRGTRRLRHMPAGRPDWEAEGKAEPWATQRGLELPPRACSTAALGSDPEDSGSMTSLPRWMYTCRHTYRGEASIEIHTDRDTLTGYT